MVRDHVAGLTLQEGEDFRMNVREWLNASEAERRAELDAGKASPDDEDTETTRLEAETYFLDFRSTYGPTVNVKIEMELYGTV